MVRQARHSSTASLRTVLREHTLRVLAHSDGNISRAAALLGIHRQSLQRRLRALRQRAGGLRRTHGGVPLTTLAVVERQHILAVLEREGGNVSQAAHALGVSRRTVRRRRAAYGAGGPSCCIDGLAHSCELM